MLTKLNILLVNAYTHTNEGEAIRQLGISEFILSHLTDVELTLITGDEATKTDFQNRFQKKVNIIDEAFPSASGGLRLKPLKAPAELRGFITSNAVISIGGYFGQLGSLFPLFLGAVMGKRLIICAASTYGPIKNRLHRFIAKRVLNRVNLITVREETSKAHLKELLAPKTVI